MFEEFDLSWEFTVEHVIAESLFKFYGVSSWEEYESPEIDAYRQKVDMVSLITSDDPEIWISNFGNEFNGKPLNLSELYHHAYHAREIKEQADAVGVATVIRYGNPTIYSDSNFEHYVQFLIRKLNE